MAKKKLKVKHIIEFHEELKDLLGEDLVYSLVWDDGAVYLAISVHKSLDKEYDHGRNIQTCQISESEFEKGPSELAKEIARAYSGLIVRKESDETK